MIEFVLPTVYSIFKDVSMGRMTESIIIVIIVWYKIKPHLTNVEQRLKGLEDALTKGFSSGEIRFKAIENRLDELEKGKQ